MKPSRLSRPALAALLLAAPALAQHFGRAYVDVRLVGRDSVHVDVAADRQDMMNTVETFPYMEGASPDEYRIYQQRLEAYLQTRMVLRADGKRLGFRAVRWKEGGKGREDGMDSVSLSQEFHVVTLGAKLPPGTNTLSVKSDLWSERDDVPPYITVEYAFHEGSRTLRRQWARTERWVEFPVRADSLARLRRQPALPPSPRVPTDHSGHEH